MPKVTRLYQLFEPSNYNLSLIPDAESMSFTGTVTISGSLTALSSKLRFHAKEFQIIGAKIEGEKLAFELDAANDELVITLPGKREGKIVVTIDFRGDITKPMHGLYPCTTGTGEIILATQFESHHAREVFPCIDEPEAKATFDVTLTSPKDLAVLANTPALSRTESKGLVVTTFEQTPIMSAYLLAFVIGNLHNVEAKTKNGTEVRVWASADHKPESLAFALETSVRCIEFYNDYFGTPYPLSKCDHVALPDFTSGAMENWGLVTYREVCLLVDPAMTSANTKEYVATVIAHELSHQWFGNLVTMKWWDDLWLNESFATLVEYIAIDTLFPEWDIMLSFASQEALSALWRDSISGVQSVYCDVTHPDQISTLFDSSIVYAKGARLLLMARNYVGDAAFRKGLQKYFAKHAYKNTVGDDLWAALSEASGKDVSAFMKTWLTQPGFPILNVDQNGTEIELSQKRFLLGKHSDTKSQWPIPLSTKPKLGTTVMNEKTMSLTSPKSDFVRFNTAGAHMSVRYAKAWQREALAELIETQDSTMSPSERLLILNDSLMQARGGVSSITETLELLTAFKHEREETVWNVMSLCIADARRLVEANNQGETDMKNFVYDVIAPLYKELGWNKIDGEPLNDTKLRGTILSLAGYSEKPEVIAEALNQLKAYDSPTSMPADTRHVLLATAVKHGDPSEFDTLFDLYAPEVNAELQQDICGALSTTRKPQNIAKILKNLTNTNFVRLQDVDRWIVYLLRNRWARQATWDWLLKNWGWIEDNFSTDKSYDHYPRYAGGVFATQIWLDAYIDFFTPLKKEPSLTRNIDLGVEEITARVAWRDRDEAKLLAWLNKH